GLVFGEAGVVVDVRVILEKWPVEVGTDEPGHRLLNRQFGIFHHLVGVLGIAIFQRIGITLYAKVEKHVAFIAVGKVGPFDGVFGAFAGGGNRQTGTRGSSIALTQDRLFAPF